MMAAPIDFYFDFSSPYGYLAAQKIEALADKYGRAVDWHPVLLGVIFKQTGMAPLTMVPLKGEYARRDFERSARFHGIAGFRMPPKFPIATQAPARIVLWLKVRDPALATRVIKALYRAFFTAGVDISDPDAAASVAARLRDAASHCRRSPSPPMKVYRRSDCGSRSSLAAGRCRVQPWAWAQAEQRVRIHRARRGLVPCTSGCHHCLSKRRVRQQ
jgi:2-hydroxychromene-2-carboxylate isomerase